MPEDIKSSGSCQGRQWQYQRSSNLNAIETHIEDNNKHETITGSYSFLIALSYLLLLLTEKGDTLYFLKCTELPVSWNTIVNMWENLILFIYFDRLTVFYVGLTASVKLISQKQT